MYLAHIIPIMLPFEPPVVRVPLPSENPTISHIRFTKACSINVAIGDSSYVYIELFASVAITSPANAAMFMPPQEDS